MTTPGPGQLRTDTTRASGACGPLLPACPCPSRARRWQSSTGGAAASKEGPPVASEPAACRRCPTTASLWAAVRAWRLKLLHRKPFPVTESVVYGRRHNSTTCDWRAAHEQALQPTPHWESGVLMDRACNQVQRTVDFRSRGVCRNQSLRLFAHMHLLQ